MKQFFRHRGRRRSSGRFFLTALMVAVIIFLGVKLIEGWRPWQVPPHSPAPSNATAAIAESADNLQGFEVFLRRGGCNGGCPYYALMYKKGTLEYVGVRGVKKQGKVTRAFPEFEQRKLLALVEQAAFFTLGKSYQLASAGCRSTRTDAPTFTVGVTLNGQTKIVKVNEACRNVPSKLRKLAQGIDRLTNSSHWTGVTSAPAGATSS